MRAAHHPTNQETHAMTRDPRRRTARPTTPVAANSPAPAVDTGTILTAASDTTPVSTPPPATPCTTADTSTSASACDAGSM
ncbi:hypothetical protein ACFU0X_20565 [Streptomyces cellulosae]|uniref:Uncharacterized protein n=1 Tax=Streptomyces cellulosae TaxID=1968 RepID=A0ABW6JJ47_STRCE